MVKDYSSFTLGEAGKTPPKREPSPLEKLGWQPFFATQTLEADLSVTPPVRVMEVHRNSVAVLGENTDETIPLSGDVTVGDWLLLNRDLPMQSQRLDRKSVFKRKAAGHEVKEQLIAANLDTVFVVSSNNQDFSVARLERYLALAFDAEVQAVIVLTKADLVDDVQPFVTQAQSISDLVPVVALNARDEQAVDQLRPWCGIGQTVALMGSSGVGKSTLLNALLGEQKTLTAGVREGDDKGRHTTTSRQIHVMTDGGLLVDTPGMRELQITDVSAGLAEVFQDIDALTTQCKFRDCQHEAEPKCAVKAAVEAGELSQERLDRWRKLVAEDAFNSASLSERRANDKSFQKMVNQAMKAKRNK